MKKNLLIFVLMGLSFCAQTGYADTEELLCPGLLDTYRVVVDITGWKIAHLYRNVQGIETSFSLHREGVKDHLITDPKKHLFIYEAQINDVEVKLYFDPDLYKYSTLNFRHYINGRVSSNSIACYPLKRIKL